MTAPIVPEIDHQWQPSSRQRWALGTTIALVFAAAQLLEALVLRQIGLQQRLLFDVLVWGTLGGLTGWASLAWFSRQERRYQLGLEQSLREQQTLNLQLQRANSQLALLSDVNRQIADSATLDEVLNAALSFPQQLIPTSAAALWLVDTDGAVETRSAGATTEQLALLRARLDVRPPAPDERRPRLLMPADAMPETAALLVPLHNGQSAVGWIELYLRQPATLPPDELALLETIASEIAEAIVSARRRSREERAIYALERAIADERARIARDIHDGLAQTMAFRRMRLDLWLDWIDTEPERLRAELIDNKRLLREQISELRRAIFALRPIEFDRLGFVGGLHRYIEEFAGQHGWVAQIDLGRAPATLTPALEAICFRIIQETLTNIAKHARATDIQVRLEQLDGGLRLVVTDDGVGFVPGGQAEQPGQRLGLRQMHERVAAVNGQLTVISQPGAGTEIRAWIPLAAVAVEAERLD